MRLPDWIEAEQGKVYRHDGRWYIPLSIRVHLYAMTFPC